MMRHIFCRFHGFCVGTADDSLIRLCCSLRESQSLQSLLVHTQPLCSSFLLYGKYALLCCTSKIIIPIHSPGLLYAILIFFFYRFRYCMERVAWFNLRSSIISSLVQSSSSHLIKSCPSQERRWKYQWSKLNSCHQVKHLLCSLSCCVAPCINSLDNNFAIVCTQVFTLDTETI